ncbi:MAG: methylamine utilization protein MauE [Deltaproteobacteria bacterium]|nr:methylamine utilization protein MauE [Deltaproteobacteria bacterium]
MLDPAVTLAARAAFALLFAGAAWHKLRDRSGFAAVLAGYRVLPERVVPAAGAALAALELATAGAWLVPGAARGAALATVALLAVYALAIGVNLARGRRAIDCGCGVGGAAQPIGEGLVARNVLLAAAALATLRPTAPRALGWLDAPTVAGVVVVAACAWTAAHGLAAAAARVRTVDARRAAQAEAPR